MERKTYSLLSLRPHRPFPDSHTHTLRHENTHSCSHTHTLLPTHPRTHTHAHAGNRWRTDVWVYMVFYTEKGCRVRLVHMRTTNLNKDHRHIHKHMHGPLWVTTETNHWSGLAVFRDNQSQWQAAPSTLRDIWMGGVEEKYGVFPEGGGGTLVACS